MSIDVVVNIINETEVEKFDWNETQVGWLQSSYFIGYMGTMIIGANVILKLLGQFKGIVLLLVLNLVVFASCKFIIFVKFRIKLFSFNHDDSVRFSRSNHFSNYTRRCSRPSDISYCRFSV